MAGVEKKSKAKARHEEVSRLYKIWLEKNPNAKKKRQIEMFDTICDNEIMSEKIQKIATRPRRKRKAADAVD